MLRPSFLGMMAGGYLGGQLLDVPGVFIGAVLGCLLGMLVDR